MSALGAEASAQSQSSGESDISETLEKCGKNLKDYDYDTAAGRRAANVEAGRCSAEAVCAYFSKGSVPSGICGPIGAKVAEWVGDAFEAIFGSNDYDEWFKAYKARQSKENEAGLIEAKLEAYQAVMDSAVELATAAMIVAWDGTVPGEKGKLGGGAELTFVWDPKFLKNTGTPSRTKESTINGVGSYNAEWIHLLAEPIQATSFQTTLPAALLLKDMGADLERRQDGRYRAPDIRLYVAPNDRSLTEARAYLKTVEQAFVPSWLKNFQAVVGKTQAFVTEAATREQARLIAERDQKELVAAQLEGEKRSSKLNWALFGLGALALGSAALYSRRRRS